MEKRTMVTMQTYRGVAGWAVEGDMVRLPDGGYGRIEYLLASGWIGVRQGARLDEWQTKQLVRC